VTQELLSQRGLYVKVSDLDPDMFLCSEEAAVRTNLVMDKLLGREEWSEDYIVAL